MRQGDICEDRGDLDYWVFHDWRPLLWVTSRLLYTVSIQSPPPLTLGLTDTVSASGAWNQPDGWGAVDSNPTPSLETGWGRAPRQEVWQQPWGKEPGPASVTQILRDRVPRPRPGRFPRLGRGTWMRDPGADQGATPAAEASSHCLPRPAMVQPAAPADDLPGRQSETIPLARQMGGEVARPGRHGNRPVSECRLGAGWSPESLADAHIRTQEGVGPALSRGPEPAAGSPGICQVPGRARAPGRLVPTSPSRRPQGHHGRLAQPHPMALGPRPTRPGLAQPSPAGPRLPEGLGRTSPLAGPGQEGAGPCLEAPPAPGRVGTAASFLSGVSFLSAGRSRATPHKHT